MSKQKLSQEVKMSLTTSTEGVRVVAGEAVLEAVLGQLPLFLFLSSDFCDVDPFDAFLASRVSLNLPSIA